MAHEKRCELCSFYYTNTYFTKIGMANRCMFDLNSRPLSISDLALIKERGCATFKAGVALTNVYYALSYYDGMKTREYGKAETAELAENLKKKMIADNIKEEDIRIVKIITEGKTSKELEDSAAAEIAAKPA